MTKVDKTATMLMLRCCSAYALIVWPLAFVLSAHSGEFKGPPLLPQAASIINYTITVDYSKTIDQYIADGRYSRKNDHINPKNFPDFEAKKDVKPGQGNIPVEATIAIVHFGYLIPTQEVLDQLNMLGYRPANLYELMELGSNKLTKNLQKEYSILALDSAWVDPDGSRFVAYLGGEEGLRRYLDLSLDSSPWSDALWFEDWRFAAVRK